MKCRLATPSDMKDIYLMGYDAWGQHLSVDEYLQQSFTTPEEEDGDYYVLENTQTGVLCASLILYDFHTKHTRIFGIGSVATPPHLRKKGYAHRLLKEVITLAMNEKQADYLLLYSDIDPGFYEKVGFVQATNFSQQSKSVCMFYPHVPYISN